MSQIDCWLNQLLENWSCDFIGIAVNVAKAEEPKQIRWCHVAGNTNDSYQHIQLRLGRGIAGMVWRTGRLQQENHILSQPAKLLEYPIARMEKLEATLGVPVFQKEKVCGVLLVGHRHSFDYSNEWIARLEKAALIVGKMMEGEQNEYSN